MPIEKYGIFSPVLGIKQDFPTISIQEGYVMTELPYTKDVLFENGRIISAKKREKTWTQQLPDPILHQTQYRLRDNTKYTIVCTKRDVAYRDDANNKLQYITPQYAVGKILVTQSSAIVYGGLEVDNCDDDPVVWADGSGGDVTPSRNTTSPKDGTAFVRLTVGAGAGVELLAYHNITSVDLSAYDSVGFWIRSSVATNAADLKFLIDNTNGCGSPLETLDIPALTANTWTWVNLTLADPSLLTAVVSIGITQAVDKGACTIDIDQIVAGDWAGQLKVGDFITIGTDYSTADTWYEILTVDSDTKITLTAVYAGTTGSQKAYLARVTYAGTNSDYWQSITFNNKWIATNKGINNIQVWAGTSRCADLSADAPKAKFITSYENYVLLGYIIEGGNDYPQKYQWCSLGDETNWTTGDAGESTISDPEFIIGFSPGTVEGYKILATTGAFFRLSAVSGDTVFDRQLITKDIGGASAYSMVNYARGIYTFCSDNTFRKVTLSSWEIVSDAVVEILKTLNFAYKENIQGTYNVEYGLLMWLIPNSVSEGYLNQVLTYDPNKNDSWGTLDITGPCFGSYFPESSTTWNTLSYATWDTWDWDTWDHFAATANFIMTTISDYSGYLYNLFQSETDNTLDYTRSFVLGSDLESQRGLGNFKRLLKIEAFFESETVGTKTIGLQVKADKQSAWQDTQDATAKSIISTTNDFTVAEFYFDNIKLARHFLFRFFAQNTFKFLGMIVYFDRGYGYRF